MNREHSPSSPTFVAVGNAPPTPPHNDPLDDIYGSTPSSPVLSSHNALPQGISAEGTHEILSDLPSRQRALDTDAYREGLSSSKGQYVQEGFDEGFSLGAELGILVGYILGVLQGLAMAIQGYDEMRWKEANELWEGARKELAIEELMGRTWVDEEGIWKWEVPDHDGDITFKEVACQHPVVSKWNAMIRDVAAEWGVDLHAMDAIQEEKPDVDLL